MHNLQTQPHLYPASYPDDEIDLFDLIEKLFAQKWIILATTALVTAVAVTAALMLPVSYTAKAVINVPSSADIAIWNSNLSHIELKLEKQVQANYLSAEKAYQLYLRYLTSPATKRYAFEQSSLATDAKSDAESTSTMSKTVLEKRYQRFQEHLSIETDLKTGRTEIHYEAVSPEESASLINQVLLPYANQQFIDNLSNTFRAQVKTKEKELLAEIHQLESSFLTHNQRRLVELKEALTLAQDGGLHKLQPGDVHGATLDEGAYLLGETLLRSMITAIKQRTGKYQFHGESYSNSHGSLHDSSTDKPYIKGVASLVFELERLKNLNPDFALASPVTIEQSALIPVFRSKPNRALMSTLGGILGLIIGVFIAMIRIALKNRKERLGA